MTAISEHDVTVLHGDVREQLATLPAQSVNCCVTSPPYFGLRDYGVDGQIGLEPSPAEYVAQMVAVFAGVRRVLADDGVLWLNLGDSYAVNGTLTYNNQPNKSRDGSSDAAARAISTAINGAGIKRTDGIPAKNLLGIPWRVAFALQDDGWILRNAVIWNKPNAMPESVTDRLSTRYEHVFLFSKSRRYWFDLDPIREPYITGDRPLVKRPRGSQSWSAQSSIGQPQQSSGGGGVGRNDAGRNPGDVWTVATSPTRAAHFATMPPELARRCILAGCPTDGTVLDPFAGSGTTLMVARQLGRNSVGVELNGDYIDIIRDRIGQTPFDFGDAS